MKFWLIDADNQPPSIAQQTAAIIGWPDRFIIAGLPGNLKTWESAAHLPADIPLDTWVAPHINDSADVLLAMAAGGKLEVMTDVAILSRDGMVAGTLGQILLSRHIRVLAISVTPHNNLPYPHLTLPPVKTTAAVSVPTYVHADLSSADPKIQANALINKIFKNRGNPTALNKSDVANDLRSMGFTVALTRSKIFHNASAFRIKPDPIRKAVSCVVRA